MNTAHVTADEDSNPDNDASSAAARGTKVCADVAVNKTADQDDQAVVFTLAVTSLGPETARNVQLTDQLPDMGGREWLLGGADSEDCALDGNSLSCDFGDLEAGATRTVTLKAYTDQMGCGDDLVNTARVSADNDGDASNDESSAVVDREPC